MEPLRKPVGFLVEKRKERFVRCLDNGDKARHCVALSSRQAAVVDEAGRKGGLSKDRANAITTRRVDSGIAQYFG